MKPRHILIVLGLTILAVIIAMTPGWIGDYRVSRLPTKVILLSQRGFARGQLSGLYPESGAGNVQYVTEDVYGRRVLSMNGARDVDDLISRDTTIAVPWNK